jgi:hypothetical protein
LHRHSGRRADAAHKGENAAPVDQFAHARHRLGRIVLIVADEITNLPTVNATALIDHIENQLAASGNGTPGRRGSGLRAPLADPDLLVIESAFRAGKPGIGKNNQGKKGYEQCRQDFFYIHCVPPWWVIVLRLTRL